MWCCPLGAMMVSLSLCSCDGFAVARVHVHVIAHSLSARRPVACFAEQNHAGLGV
jgi:hypothetical protein